MIHRLRLAVLVCVASFPLAALGARPGTADGYVADLAQTTPLRFAFARADAAGLTILLTSEPMTAATASTQKGAASVELRLDAAMRVIGAAARHRSRVRNFKLESVGFETNLASTRMINATVTGVGDDLSFEATFTAAIGQGAYGANAAAEAAMETTTTATPRPANRPAPAPLPEPATPLPSNGGEPWTAYLLYDAAFRRADLPALRKLMTRAAIEDLERSGHIYPQGVEYAVALTGNSAPVQLRFRRGTIDGDRAELVGTGTPVVVGGPTDVRVVMVREGGVWKVDRRELAQSANGRSTEPVLPDVDRVTSGTALPAGGGELASVWQRYDVAVRATDERALRSLFINSIGERIADAPLGMMRVGRPAEIRIDGGFVRGDVATLHLGATKPVAGIATTGFAVLRRENGVWKMVREVWPRAR